MTSAPPPITDETRGSGMFQTIYGVDFSGAKLAGKTTWIAQHAFDARHQRLRLLNLQRADKVFGSPQREAVMRGLVEAIAASESALWAINFPFGFPIEVMAAGCRWQDQFDFLADWGEDAYGAGVECLNRALALGGPMHLRRLTDVLDRTPFDVYHYRIIYQTFYGMRDVLGPLRTRSHTAILPFQHRRLAKARRVVVESCPASTLKRLGLPHQNYKQATWAAR